MTELMRAARLIASGDLLAIDTMVGVGASEPGPGCQAAISRAKRIIGRHLLPQVISDARVQAAGHRRSF